jgi:hypothetical protein
MIAPMVVKPDGGKGDRILIPKPNQQAIAFGILDVVSTLMKQNSAAYRWL